MKYQVWIYKKKKWQIRNFSYEYNSALLFYCKKCIKHGSANVRFYLTISSTCVKRIMIEPLYGERVLIADELSNGPTTVEEAL